MTEQLTLALSFPSKWGISVGRISVAPGLLSPTWSISILQEIHKSLTWQTLRGWLIQCLHLSILPAIGSSPGCLCCQLSWAAGRASPLSPSLLRTFPSLPEWPRGGLHSCFEERGMSSYLILSLAVWNSKHNSRQRHFPLKSSINPQFLHLHQYFMPLVWIQNPRILSHQLDLGLSPL